MDIPLGDQISVAATDGLVSMVYLVSTLGQLLGDTLPIGKVEDREAIVTPTV